MNKLNNAQIMCINRVAIIDYEVVDTEQKIWKGTLVFDRKSSEEAGIVFFSRKYDRTNNDIDRMMDEYEMKDESVIGTKFLLVPREKLLFAYQLPSTIIRPEIKLTRPTGL